MALHRARFGVALLAIAAVFTTTDADMSDAGGDIVMLSESEEAGVRVNPPAQYSEIPGFKFNYDSHKVDVQSRTECQTICTGQATCHSYNWAEDMKLCEWSTSKMQYDPDFIFNFKPAAGGAYHQFPGLVYRATGWLKSTDKSNRQCAALCDQAAACAAYSYRAVDSLCMLSGHQVGFDDNYAYYEKEGPHKEFGLRPNSPTPPPTVPGERVVTPAPTAPPLPTPSPQSRQDMINAAVQAAKAAADAAISQSQATARALGAPGVPEAQVEERLQAVKDWAADKLAQKDAEEKLKMKAYELDSQAQLEKQRDTLEKKAAEEKADAEKKTAKQEADRKEADAAQKADDMLAKVRLDAEKASVAAELSTAAKDKRDAQVATDAAKSEKDTADEKVEKATAESASKAAAFHTQKDNMVQRDQMIKEKDTKSMHAQLASAIALNVADVRKEMAEKSKTSNAAYIEKDEKVMGKAGNDQATAAREMKELRDRLTTSEDKDKSLTADLLVENGKVTSANAAELRTKGEMKVAVDSANDDTAAKIQSHEVEAKQDANKNTAAAYAARDRASEQLRKVARVQTDAEKASLEAAEKAGSKDRICTSELKQMQMQAITEEQAVAEQASLLKDDAAAQKLLNDKKTEWNTKIEGKKASCYTSALVYTTKAAPKQSVSVKAPTGPSEEEEVSLLQVDPWPLDKPIRAVNDDGSPGASVPVEGAAARLAESNAAAARGYTEIEGGAGAQTAYFKFPGKVLTTSETLKSVTLEFDKKGGPEADCFVKLTGCQYEAGSITYDTKPIAMNAVSAGETFPAADGMVKMSLDVTLIDTELSKNPTDPEICIEISGGIANDPDLITDVTLSMKVQREASAPTAPVQRIDVEIPRRRRSALDESRRRRSVQAIKDQAVKLELDAEDEIKPEISDEAASKMPLKLENKKVEIEKEMRADLPNIIERKVKEELAVEFSADQMKSSAAELRRTKVETEINKNFPAKYAQEKAALETNMKNKLTEDMTAEETKIIDSEATAMADTTVKSDTETLLQGAIDKKFATDYAIEMQKELENKAPTDISTALDVVVIKSVEEKTAATVAETVRDEIQKEMLARETGVATAAATLAVNTKLSELVQAAISSQVQTEKTTGTATGVKLSSNDAGQRAQGLQIVTNAVAGRPSPLTQDTKKEIERLATNTAVQGLRNEITGEVNAKFRQAAYVDNVVMDLKQRETLRLRPIVKADILKDLEEELKPDVTKRVKAAAEAYVNQEKTKVLRILRNALIQKNKVELLPTMNAKLSVDVPNAISSVKFQAQMEAAVLEMKAELKATMKKNLNDPLERVANAQIKEEETEKSEALQLSVKAKEDTAFAARVTAATALDKIEPGVEAASDLYVKKKVQRAVRAKLKEEVMGELAMHLKNAIWAKYKTGTDEESAAYVKQHYEKDIRARVKADALKRADTTAGTKAVDAKEALKTQLIGTLTDQMFSTAKAEYADQLVEDTRGMNVADAKAVEFNKDQQLKLKAKQDAERQAEIEVAGQSGEQLALRLKQEEEQRVLEEIEKEIKTQVKRKIDALTQKALTRVYDDDLQAMEMGRAHVSEITLAGQETDKNAPNIEAADREAQTPIVKQALAGAAAVAPGGVAVEAPVVAPPVVADPEVSPGPKGGKDGDDEEGDDEGKPKA